MAAKDDDSLFTTFTVKKEVTHYKCRRCEFICESQTHLFNHVSIHVFQNNNKSDDKNNSNNDDKNNNNKDDKNNDDKNNRKNNDDKNIINNNNDSAVKKNHDILVHDGSVHECGLCDFVTTTKTNLVNHGREVHRTERLPTVTSKIPRVKLVDFHAADAAFAVADTADDGATDTTDSFAADTTDDGATDTTDDGSTDTTDAVAANITKSLKCPTCEIVADSSAAFKNHLKSHSASASSRKCRRPLQPLVEKISVGTKGSEVGREVDETLERLQVFNKEPIDAKDESQEKKFKCKICDFATIHHDSLYSHRLLHSNCQLYKCKFCNYVTYNSQLLKRHVLKTRCLRLNLKGKNSVQNPFHCASCKFSCKQMRNLINHTKNHKFQKMKIVQCNRCNIFLKTVYGLRQHLAVHSKEKPFKCTRCDYASKHKRCLNAHMKNHSANVTLKSNTKSLEGFKSSEPKYSQAKGTIRDLKSFKCNESTSSVHSQEKPLNCNVCKKEFKEKKDLKEHMRKSHPNQIKSKNKPFECGVCFLGFTMRNNLLQHIRKFHPDLHLYKCKKCNFTSNDYKTYRQHLTKHIQLSDNSENMKSLQCNTCSAKFETKSGLNRHKCKLVYNHKLQSCTRCDFTSKDIPMIQNHIKLCLKKSTDVIKKNSLPKRLHKCHSCKFSTDHISSLNRHQNRLHKAVTQKQAERESSDANSMEAKAISSESFYGIPEKPKVSATEPDQSVETESRDSIVEEEKKSSSQVEKPPSKKDNEKIYKCRYCHEKLICRFRFGNHMKKHCNERPHKCELCSYRATTVANLRRHVDCQHRKKLKSKSLPPKIIKCNSNRNSRTILKSDTPSGQARDKLDFLQIVKEKPYNCKFCSYCTTNDKNLRRHHLSQHREKSKSLPPKIIKCSSKRKTPSNKKQNAERLSVTSNAPHIEEERPLNCKYCSYRANNAKDLLKHRLRQHQKNKTIKCNHCDYSTSSNLHLNRHKTRMNHYDSSKLNVAFQSAILKNQSATPTPARRDKRASVGLADHQIEAMNKRMKMERFDVEVNDVIEAEMSDGIQTEVNDSDDAKPQIHSDAEQSSEIPSHGSDIDSSISEQITNVDQIRKENVDYNLRINRSNADSKKSTNQSISNAINPANQPIEDSKRLDTNFKCRLCGFRAKNKLESARHSQSHVFKVMECKWDTNMDQRVTRDPFPAAAAASSAGVAAPPPHPSPHPSTKQFKCSICDFVAHNMFALEVHQRETHNRRIVLKRVFRETKSVKETRSVTLETMKVESDDKSV